MASFDLRSFYYSLSNQKFLSGTSTYSSYREMSLLQATYCLDKHVLYSVLLQDFVSHCAIYHFRDWPWSCEPSSTLVHEGGFSPNLCILWMPTSPLHECGRKQQTKKPHLLVYERAITLRRHFSTTPSAKASNVTFDVPRVSTWARAFSYRLEVCWWHRPPMELLHSCPSCTRRH